MGCPLGVLSAESILAKPTSTRLTSHVSSNTVSPRRNEVHAAFRGVEYICHRGYLSKGVPENSLLSMDLAAKYDLACEIDLRETNDGIVVLFHDNNTKRMTGVDRKIAKASFAELQDFSLAGSDQRIPSLRSVLKRFPSLPLLLDAKDGRESSIASVVHQYRATDRVLLLIRDAFVADELIRKYPELALCISIGSQASLQKLGDRRSQRASFMKALLRNVEPYLAVSFEIRAVNSDAVKALRDAGKLVLAYRTKKRSQYELCKNCGLIPVTDYYP